MVEQHRFGWVKDPVSEEHKFGSIRYGFLKTERFSPQVDNVKRHSLFEQHGLVPGVYHQADLGSCTSNALLAAFLVQMAKNKQSQQDLSRLFLYYEQRVRDGTVGRDCGSSLYSGVEVLKNLGVCADNDWQYIPPKFREKPPQKAYHEALRRMVVDAGPVVQDVRNIKQCLIDGNPVVFGFMVFANFSGPDVPDPSGRKMGGHAAMIFGFDDNKMGGCFMARNSWGDKWGDRGNFYIKYSYLMNRDLAGDFWTIRAVKVI